MRELERLKIDLLEKETRRSLHHGSIPEQQVLPPDLRLGFEILNRSALAFYCAGRSDAEMFWGADSTTLAAALDDALAQRSAFNGSYMTNIPSYYGHDQPFDAAVECLLTAVSAAFQQGQVAARKSSQAHYARALTLVRKNIAAAQAGSPPPEHLAATVMLLTVYDSVSGDSVLAWTTHMAGLAALFSAGGADKQRSIFEEDVLFAAMPGLIAEAIVNDHACFLAQDSWQGWIIRRLPDRAMDASFCAFSHLPGLLAACREITEAPDSFSEDHIMQVLEKTRKVRDRMLSLLPPKPLPLHELVASRPPMWYTFSEVEQITGNYCNNIMSICVLSRIIVALAGGPPELEDFCMQSATDVLALSTAITQSYVCNKCNTNDKSGKIGHIPKNPTGQRQKCEHDPGPRMRIIHLRSAFAILKTSDLFLEHVLEASTPSPGYMGPAPTKIISQKAWHAFHRRVRGV